MSLFFPLHVIVPSFCSVQRFCEKNDESLNFATYVILIYSGGLALLCVNLLIETLKFALR